MGFLDNLKDKAEEFGERAKAGYGAAKDKASDLIADVNDRLDEDDATSADKVEAAADKAAAGASATETAADQVGDVGSAPAADPLEPGGQVADEVDAPAENATDDVTEDPLDPRHEAVDPIIEPAQAKAVDDDPLEAAPDRTA